jgi:hypothetical protein
MFDHISLEAFLLMLLLLAFGIVARMAHEYDYRFKASPGTFCCDPGKMR